MVSIPDFSKELCGGTHVTRTGDIGVFKIVSESSISAGVRRIEAITGEGAVAQFQESSEALHRMAGMLRVAEPELVEQVDRLIAEKRDQRTPDRPAQDEARAIRRARSGIEGEGKERREDI